MNLAQLIEHTLLRPEATSAEIKTLCDEAKFHGFYGVCVHPYWISTVREFLKGSHVKVVTVVGFPMGMTSPKAKAAEVKACVEAGADELDVMVNLACVREGHWNFVEHEIHEMVSMAQGKVVKVIIEAGLLDEEEIINACQCAERAGASFVKTSTGFLGSGATIDMVKLMRGAVSERVGVKASGGIKTRELAEALVEAGADRIGSSSSVTIVPMVSTRRESLQEV